jgi:hypothetical protein
MGAGELVVAGVAAFSLGHGIEQAYESILDDDRAEDILLQAGQTDSYIQNLYGVTAHQLCEDLPEDPAQAVVEICAEYTTLIGRVNHWRHQRDHSLTLTGRDALIGIPATIIYRGVRASRPR